MENRCVSCGAIIPEGRMVCPECEASVGKPDLVDRSVIISRLKNSQWWQPADLHTALSCVEDAPETEKLIRLSDLDKICQKAIDYLLNEVNEPFAAGVMKGFLDTVKKIHTVDAASEVKPRNNRRTGHWVYDPNANDWCIGGWCCSKCHYKNDTLGISKKLHLPIRAIAGTRYCAQCGAEMSEEATK